MASFNDFNVNPRSNRPSVESRTLLSHYQINGGSYQDPFMVSSVYIFPDIDGSPDRYLDLDSTSETFGQIAASALSANENGDFLFVASFVPPMIGGYFAESDYVPSSATWSEDEASYGIYRTSEGKYHIVQDGGLLNSASAVGAYWDIWTVVDFETSLPRVFAHKVNFYNDTVIGITEPLNITVNTNLKTKYITRGSTQNIKITNECFVNNRNLPNDIKSIFRDSVVTNAEIQLLQVNKNNTNEVLEDWTDADDVLSDDTIIYKFNTEGMWRAGEVKVKVRFSALDETYVNSFILVVREP